MVDELGRCNAGVVRAACVREGYRDDAWDKFGQETGDQQAFLGDFEHLWQNIEEN